MSDYEITNTIIGAQNISVTSTTQNHPLGLIVQAVDRADTAYGAGEFVYLKGVASTVLGSFVTYNATAGSIDDAVVAGDRVKLAKGASAIGTPSTGLAEFEIQRPFMDDATAA